MLKRRIFGVLLGIMVIFAAGGIYAEPISANAELPNGPQIVKDGELHQIPAIIVDGRTFLPLGYIANLLNIQANWDESNLHFYLTNNTIYVTISAQILEGHVPLRYVAEAFGFEVGWDYDNFAVIINSPEPAPGPMAGPLTTIAGTGAHGHADGHGSIAQFNLPQSIFAGSDNIFVLDTYNNLIRQFYNGMVTRFSGDILAYDDWGFAHGFWRDGDLSEALFNRPVDGLICPNDRIFIADAGNNAIRVIDGEGVLTLAIAPLETDEGLNFPSALAMDNDGNLFIADSLNHVIRKIDADGNLTTIAGQIGIYGFAEGAAENSLLDTPMGIALADDGRIFVADTGNNLIRIIENGIVSTLAGSRIVLPHPDWGFLPAGGFQDGFAARFNQPMGLALWNDILIVADSGNHRIRAVLPTGETITLAGSGYPDYLGGPAHEAALHLPSGVYIVNNTLFIADTGNNAIRRLAINN
jgi:hypothetical protein